MNNIAQLIVKYRLSIIVICIVITLILGHFASRLTVNSNFMSYLPKEDCKVVLFEQVDSLYSTGNIVIIGVSDKNDLILTKTKIDIIRQVTESISSIEGIEKVTSLSNVIDIRGSIDGVEIRQLIDDNIDDNSLPQLQEYILSKDLYREKLLSIDGHSTALVAFIKNSADKEFIAEKIENTLTEIQVHHPTIDLYCDGLPIQQLNLTKSTEKDLILLVPIVCILIALVLLIVFRSFRGIALPLLSVFLGSIWCMGMMGILDVELSPISGSIPVVLFAVGSAYTIHVLNFFNISGAGDTNRKHSIANALSVIGVPVMLAGLTTIIGFLSFIPGTYLSIIKDFGIFMALGTLFCLIISLTLIPAIESYRKASYHPKKQLKISNSFNFFDVFFKISLKRPKKSVFIGIVLVLAGGTGVLKLRSNIDILYYFSDNHPMRQSSKFLNKNFGGSLPIQIKVKGDLTEPTTLLAMQDFENFLLTLPNVHNPQSIVGLITEMNLAMGEKKEIPNDQNQVKNLWFLLEGEPMLEQLSNFLKDEGIIHATMTNSSTQVYHEISTKIDEYISFHNTSKLYFEATGIPFIYSNFDENLMKNLFGSLLLACVLVFICMVFLVRSLKGAFIGFIPLVGSMLFIFGIMGFLEISLNLATVLIAGVAIGIGVDYSIHFLSGYKKNLSSEGEIRQAVFKTLTTSGKGIFFNVITVAAGFLVLVFADLVPLREFGMLMFITMLISGFAATLLLPSLILCFNINLNKK